MTETIKIRYLSDMFRKRAYRFFDFRERSGAGKRES